MRYLGTLAASGLMSAALGLAPTPTPAQEADMILRLFNGLIANEFAARRGDIRGVYRDDDDDDGYRRHRHDDDDDGNRRARNDDDDDGRWRRRNDDDD